MMDWIQRHKGGILAGVLSSAMFLYCLDPLVGLVVKLFAAVGEVVGASYSERIYSQASHLETQNFSFFIWGLALAVTTGACGGMAFALARKERKRSTAERRPRKHGRAARNVAAALLFAYALLPLPLLAANYTQLKLISTFTRDMRILAPYLSEEEEEEFLSSWSLMRSAKDHQEIYESLSLVASDHGIELPENDIYSPFTL